MDSSLKQLQTGIRTLLASGQFDRVISICKSTLEAARRTSSTNGEITSLLGLAAAHRYLGKFHDAQVLAEGALKSANDISHIPLITDALMECAFIKLEGSHQPISARDDFHEALKLAHKLEDSTRMSEALRGIALAWQALDYHDRGLRYAREAFEQARMTEDMLTQTWALMVMGSLLQSSGDHQKALSALHDALSRAQTHEFEIISGHVRVNLGRLMLFFAPEAENADEYFADVVQMAERTQCAYLEHISRAGLASAYAGRAQYERAAEQMAAMTRLSERIESESYALSTYVNLGSLEYQQAAYGAALDYFERALLMSRSLTNPHYEAICLQWLGMTHARRYEFKEAIGYLGDAHAVHVALDNGRAARNLLAMRAWTLVLAGLDRIMRLLGLRH